MFHKKNLSHGIFKITQELSYGFICFLFCFENFVHTHNFVYVAPNLGKFMNNLINFFVTSQQYRKLTRSSSSPVNLKTCLTSWQFLPIFAYLCPTLPIFAYLWPTLPVSVHICLYLKIEDWPSSDNLGKMLTI